MRAMEGLRVCAAVATISLIGAGVAHAGAQVAHFKSNGANASHNSFNGTTAFDLGVSTNTQPSSGTTTFLSFNTQTCAPDFSICSGVFGSGPIPNADFSVNGANATLNTNTNTNPNFTVFNYVQDNINGTFTTSPGVGGIVAINWKKNGLFSTDFKGTSSFVSHAFTHSNTGEQISDSATATGALLGQPLPSMQSSFIGTAKSKDTIISRN
jgi:hypothetical protein